MDAGTKRRIISIIGIGLLALGAGAGAGAGVELFRSSDKAKGRLAVDMAPGDSSVAATSRSVLAAESERASIAPASSAGLAQEVVLTPSVTSRRNPTESWKKVDGSRANSVMKGSSRTSGERAIGCRSNPDVAAKSYQPIPVRQAIDLDGRAGVVLNHAGDLAFHYRPEAYPQGAMRLLNASGGAVAVSFHGEGVATVRLNGQVVQEGVRYLVAGDGEIRGTSAVGVHVRSPRVGDSVPAPVGAG